MDVTYLPTQPPVLALCGIAIIALLSVVAWLYYRRRSQSHRLRLRFGPEYAHAVDSMGGRSKAEADWSAS